MLIELIIESLLNLKTNLLRTALTMIGIILGIAAVVTIMNLGRSSYKAVADAISNAGFGGIIITLNYEAAAPNEVLDQSVVDFLKSHPIEGVEGYSLIANSETGNASTIDERIFTVDTDYRRHTAVQHRKLIAGHWFSENDDREHANVGIIDGHLADNFFGGAQAALGKWLEVEYDDDYRYYQIIGVEPKPGYINNDDAFGTLTVPFNLAEQTNEVRNYGYRSISVLTNPQSSPQEITDKLEKVIINAFDYDSIDDAHLEVKNASKDMEEISQFMSVFSIGISLIAAISLLVGGVGIMNIMLVSVTERTKEIGLLKAIGAKERDIISVFLVESVMMTIFGGLIGIGLGIAVSTGIIAGINQFGSKELPTFPYTIDINAIMISLGVSSLIGLIFGIMPAVRAAKLNPVDALRHE